MLCLWNAVSFEKFFKHGVVLARKLVCEEGGSLLLIHINSYCYIIHIVLPITFSIGDI